MTTNAEIEYGNSGPFRLRPQEKLSEAFCEELKKINAGRPTHDVYCRRVEKLFGLKPFPITKETKIWLSGFIEGEGSVSVGAKKNKNATFGVELDPCFNITQHVNGIQHLYTALRVFGAGRIRYKVGSNATLVFSITTRRTLVEKVIPYINEYAYKPSCLTKKERYKNYELLLNLFDERAHLDRTRMIEEVLPLWNEMRMQSGYRGETFVSLQAAQDFVRNYVQ